MSGTVQGGPSRDERLGRIIADYITAIGCGERPDRRELLQRHADLAAELRAYFTDFDRGKGALGPRGVQADTAKQGEFSNTRSSPPDDGAAATNAEQANACLVGNAPEADLASDATLALSPSPAAASHEVSNRAMSAARYFGDYELLGEIARGGMGVVYKARQVSLNRLAAVKMILAGHLASEADVQRFRAEAEAAANLQHPGIVAIFEVGEHGGQQFFSMEYVEGQSLAQLVREGTMPARTAAGLVAEICDAIHYAHERGVLHRDLKPANVLLQQRRGEGPASSPNAREGSTRSPSNTRSQSSGHAPSTATSAKLGSASATPLPASNRHNSGLRPKVTDFGLAKRIEGGSELTGTGQVLGTPSYMPPEQAAARRGDVGPQSDVYSLGAVLYELLTARPPFRAETPLETLLQVLDAEPAAPRLLNPALDSDIETITLKCLDKSPARRYASAAALAADLRRYVEGEPIEARPIGPAARAWRWCKRKPVVAGLIAAVSVLAVAVVVGAPLAALRQASLRSAAERQATAARKAEAEAGTQAKAARKAKAEADRRRRQAEKAKTELRNTALGALEALSQSRLHEARAMWNSPQPDRQRNALERIEEAARYRNDSRKLLAQFSKSERHLLEPRVQFWESQTLELRNEALRWLSGTSLEPLSSISAPVASPWLFGQVGMYGGQGQNHSAVSPDGKQIAALVTPVNGLPRVELLDALTGRVVEGFDFKATPGWAALATSMAFVADGERLLVVRHEERTADGLAQAALAIEVRDAATGEIVSADSAPFDRNRGLQPPLPWAAAPFDVSHDARHFIANGTVFDLDKGASAEFGPDFWALGFTSSGAQVYGLAGGALEFRSLDPSQPLATSRRCTLHGPSSNGLSVSPDGRWVAVSGQFTRSPLLTQLQIIDAASGAAIGETTIYRHEYFVSNDLRRFPLAFSPDGGMLAVVTPDRLLLIAAPEATVISERKHLDPAPAASSGDDTRQYVWLPLMAQFNSSGTRLTTSMRWRSNYGELGPDQAVQTWDVAAATLAPRGYKHQGQVTAVRFAASGGRLVSAAQDGTVHGWDANDGGGWSAGYASAAVAPPPTEFDASGGRCITAPGESVELRDASDGKQVLSLAARNALAFSPSRRLLAARGQDEATGAEMVRVYDLAEDGVLANFACPGVQAADFSPDDRFVFARGPRVLLGRVGGEAGEISFEASLVQKDFPAWNCGRGLAVLDADGARVIDLANLKELFRPPAGSWWTSDDLSSLAVSVSDRDPNGQPRSRIAICRLPGGETIYLDGDLPKVRNIKFAAQGTRCLVQGYALNQSGEVAQLWGTDPPRLLRHLDLPQSCEVWAGDNLEHVGLSYYDASKPSMWLTEIWNVQTGETKATFPSKANRLGTNPRFLLAEENSVVDLSTGENLATGNSVLKLAGQPIFGTQSFLPFTADGKLLLTFDFQSRIIGWDLVGREQKFALPTGAIFAAAVSPDSRWLASYGADARSDVRVWDLATGSLRSSVAIGTRPGSPAGPHGVLRGIRIHPDGRSLLIDVQGEVRLADLETGRLSAVWGEAAHQAPVRDVDISSDGTLAASAGDDGIVCLWDAATGRNLGLLEGYSQPPRRVAFVPGGEYLLTLDAAGGLLMWKLARTNGAEAQRIVAEVVWELTSAEANGGKSSLAAGSLFMSPQGEQFVCAAADGAVTLHRTETGEALRRLQGAGTAGKPPVCSFRPDARALATAGGDGLIRLWDLATGKQSGGWPTTESEILCLAFDPSGDQLGVAGAGISLWDVKKRQLLARLAEKTPAAHGLSFSADGRWLAAALDDGNVTAWDLEAGQTALAGFGLAWPSKKAPSQVASGAPPRAAAAAVKKAIKPRQRDVWRRADDGGEMILAHKSTVWSVAFSPDSSLLATASQEGQIRLWDMASRKLRHTLEGHTALVRSVTFSPDGKTLYSGGHDLTLRIWDVATGRQKTALEDSSGLFYTSVFPDARTLVSGSQDVNVRLWDLERGEIRRVLTGLTSTAWAAAVSHDGKLVAGGGPSGVCIWDPENGGLLRELPVPKGGANVVAFSPRGTRLATANADWTVGLWDAQTGALERSLRGPAAVPYDVTFSADGAQVACASGERIVRRWNVETGSLIDKFRGGGYTVAFSPNGQWLASGGDDGAVRLWNAQPAKPKPE